MLACFPGPTPAVLATFLMLDSLRMQSTVPLCTLWVRCEISTGISLAEGQGRYRYTVPPHPSILRLPGIGISKVHASPYRRWAKVKVEWTGVSLGTSSLTTVHRLGSQTTRLVLPHSCYLKIRAYRNSLHPRFSRGCLGLAVQEKAFPRSTGASCCPTSISPVNSPSSSCKPFTQFNRSRLSSPLPCCCVLRVFFCMWSGSPAPSSSFLIVAALRDRSSDCRRGWTNA